MRNGKKTGSAGTSWPSLQVTLLSFPSACLLKQEEGYFICFLLPFKLNEERGFSGNEVCSFMQVKLPADSYLISRTGLLLVWVFCWVANFLFLPKKKKKIEGF